MAEIVSTRVPDYMAKDLKAIEKEENSDRATVVRKLLSKAIADWKLQHALTLYSTGKVTLWKASKIADLSLWEIMDTVKARKITSPYSYEDFREDFESALKEK